MEKTLLQGLKVLDLTRVLAGPYCTMQMADLGAEVVKIERPETGDDSRFFGPFTGGQSAYFLSLNRNKKSVTLDLKSWKGCEIFKDLVSEFDVVVENFRPGTMEKMNLGYEQLRIINPRLVYAAISGFGATGPDRSKPAYDIVIQGRGGIMSITGQEGGTPTRTGASISDISSGLFATIAVLSAYIEALKTGRGNKIDISMLDCQVAILENAIARYVTGGEVPGPIGNRHPSITPFTTLKAADQYIIVAAANQKLWDKLCRIIGLPELARDSRFETNDLRTRNWSQLEPILNQAFSHKTAGQWLGLLEEEGIPCGLVQDVPGLLNDGQLLNRKMIRDIAVTSGSPQTIKVAGAPYHFFDPPVDKFQPAPALGQNTEEILQKYAGLNRKDCRDLKDKGIV